MRFEQVHAHAFGPMRAESLQFQPGMNVVYGVNEAGKSTWHAALYLGLCGMRLGKGKKKEDQELEHRHRPWDDANAWDVGVTVLLADGRRVELRHDLAGKLSSAKDADIAERDYQGEILSEGMPDGARWLGLNRRSFLRTACVRQADMLAVRDDARGLRSELQAAVGNAEGDTTAARALAALADFRRERIGSSRAPTKPLATSRKQVEAAKRQLEEVRKAHATHRDELRRLEELQQAAREHSQQLRVGKAAQARGRAEEAKQRWATARELAAEFPNGPPPPVPNEAELLAQAAAAVATWNSLPALRKPDGETLESLMQQKSSAETDLAAVQKARPSRRPVLAPTVAAVALLGGGALAIVPDFIALGAVFAVLGSAVLWWATRQAQVESARRIASDTDVLTERCQSLARVMNHRRLEEEAYDHGLRRRADAARRLHETATAAGLASASPEAERKALADWQTRRPAQLAAAERAHQRWSELKGLLGDKSLAALREESERREQEALALLAECGEQDWDAIEQLPPLADLVAREQRAQVELAEARGSLSARRLADLAEAEDACVAARQKMERVERLDATIETTIRFLRAAEEKTHRDVARVLRKTMLEWLAIVTSGRYTDCRVNPETLEVEVCAANGRWRNAALLSHGAAEQIYLVVRLALVRHLTTKKEISPLVLDDVVSACDSVRMRAILGALLAIGEQTQVILFTHDATVRDWAREHMTDPARLWLINLEQPKETAAGAEQIALPRM